MGIPKFFRYIAQRWPLTSQQVNDNVIPEFDNLYLDMNSILHTATHNNAENIGHLTEDQMYLQICNYIEHLFAVIAPRRVFFMAIDGVAPRAKMNQQRARRFRSAMDAETSRRKAAERGDVLDDDPFDSNCITPGTEFMAKLTQRLRYFIARKITEDSRWQGCSVILSGHEVPGEGEHKIMRFIRNIRSQPDYDPNTRHCLYGLDADLIMLGLSTHEPHFALLREEVTFGRQVRFQSAELSEKRFILLHLSLVREYIQIELKDSKNSVEPDFERELDDFVLINFFIGNDFLPELPMLMVNEGAIPVILDTYKAYLRNSGNKYLSHNGVIDFMALKQWMDFLKVYQVRKFEESSQDLVWFNTQLENLASEAADVLVLTQPQREVFDTIAPQMLKAIRHDDSEFEIEFDGAERKFVELLAEQTGFEISNDKLRYVSGKVDSKMSRKVIRLYDHAHVKDPSKTIDYDSKFTEWKNRYYFRKFGDTYDSEIVQKTAEKYLEGLQWVLFYYYQGCPSWSWFFDNHYAPMTTEIITAIGDGFAPKFNEGTPFLPFEQLMSVLPDRSVKLLPPALRPLVLEPTSPIIDFYPHEFAVDKNGKRADWEAVVLIPFIDQDRLLKYVKPIEEQGLTPAEKQRNSQGVEYEFSFDPNAATLYRAPSPTLADIPACTCVVKQLTFSHRDVRYGLLDGALMGITLRAGFPSLYTLPFNWSIARNEGVKVFEMPSRDDSVILSIGRAEHAVSVGDRIFVNWPFLTEAEVVEVLSQNGTPPWTRVLPRLAEDYTRHGVKIGDTEALIRVRELQGLMRHADGAYTKEFGGQDTIVPVQLVVPRVAHQDPRFVERAALPLSEEFPLDSTVLLLLAKYYGFPAKILKHGSNNVDVEVLVPRYRDPLFGLARGIADNERARIRWSSTDQVARSLGVSVKFLLQLTSRLMIEANGENVNISLPLRKHGMGLMAEGYSRLGYRGMWEFSDRGVALLLAYLKKFRDAFTKLRSNTSLDVTVAKSMRDWVKANTEQIAFLPTSTNHLTHHSVALIEEKILQMPATRLEKVVVKGIDRGALLSSDKAHHQLRNQNFKLGDRVVSALSFGKVPIYMRGVVVGVNGGSPTSTTLDIVWDHEFAAGSTLDGRSKSSRGLTVNADSVLNLSFPQLTYHQNSHRTQNFIGARANMRSTPATNNRAKAPQDQSKRFVPAEVHNDWVAAKQSQPNRSAQVKTNASGQELLNALRGAAGASTQGSAPQSRAAETGVPPFSAGEASAAGEASQASFATEAQAPVVGPQIPVAVPTTAAPAQAAVQNKASAEAHSSAQGPASSETSQQRSGTDGVGRTSKRSPRNQSGKPSKADKGGDSKSTQPRQSSGPAAKTSSGSVKSFQKKPQQKRADGQKKHNGSNLEEKKKTGNIEKDPAQKTDQQESSEKPADSFNRKVEQVQPEPQSNASFVLPEVKGTKPRSAESARTLLDTLMLKN